MEMIDVNTLVIPAECDDNVKLYDEIIACAIRNGTKIISIDEDTVISCGDINLSIYCSGIGGEENERCLMFKAELPGVELLVTGDATATMQRRLAEKQDLSGVDAFMVAHHGSKYSVCEELLAEVGGDIAMISVGQNYYGHPAEETLEALAYWGYNVYRTDVQGNLKIEIGQ